MKVKFVQLEPDAFLTDLDFVAMTLEERGAYFTLILYLYSNNGKCDLNISVLSKLCTRLLKHLKKSGRTFQKSLRHAKA